jgi:hypothetical protein
LSDTVDDRYLATSDWYSDKVAASDSPIPPGYEREGFGFPEFDGFILTARDEHFAIWTER